MPTLQSPRLSFSLDDPGPGPEEPNLASEAASRVHHIKELEKKIEALQTDLMQSDANIQVFCSTTSSLYATLKLFVEEADQLVQSEEENNASLEDHKQFCQKWARHFENCIPMSEESVGAAQDV
ncbi:hypothetical protein KCU78_g4942, partial [Aureobasidium melanogenum]